MASRQHGAITGEQAAASGLSRQEVRTLVERGMWERRWREVFTIAGAPRTYESDVMVACLAAGPTAMACRGTVARLLGFGRPYFDSAAVEVVVQRGASTRSAKAVGATVRRASILAPADRNVLDGIPATSPSRLIVDLLDVQPDAVFALADDILHRRMTTPSAVRGTFNRIRASHRDVLDAVLLPWTPGHRPGSPKEMSLSRVLQLHGLPAPVRQHRVEIPGRARPRFLDLAYPSARLALEYDGRIEHGPRRWDADTRREDELAAAGWLRLPAGRMDLVEPGATIFCSLVRDARLARAA